MPAYLPFENRDNMKHGGLDNLLIPMGRVHASQEDARTQPDIHLMFDPSPQQQRVPRPAAPTDGDDNTEVDIETIVDSHIRLSLSFLEQEGSATATNLDNTIPERRWRAMAASASVRRWQWLAALIVIGLAAAYWGWKYTSAYWHGLHRASSVDGSQYPAQCAANTSAVLISITVTPPNAALTVDGVRVSNPYVTSRTADFRSHDVIVGAPGHSSVFKQMQFDRDLTLVFALVRDPQLVVPEDLPLIESVGQTSGAVRSKTNGARFPTNPNRIVAGTHTGCEPPFVIDAAGVKSFKPECLSSQTGARLRSDL
jgi:hypothetical protein